ncbi:PREDICTED: ATP-dependent RNA helicase SUV3 homolog, mitochondrial [Ceratosolen solmsi marchali]|uniref:ATP-dependent RNA helicase SUV3 homolog, mitochondrial n=1 Tax=Ceratosolen solmsi marchali TaxID=326594 RepID=A0AAJ6YT13_9HYME|nr:PREDICTED: ATP-dependent RNA helicase SUV3 homolog, mitochondrial [Ceratosolen solmsi marchali]
MQSIRTKNDYSSPSSLIKPISVKLNSDDINVGVELTTDIKKSDLRRILNSFITRNEVIKLASEYGLEKKLFQEAFCSFQHYCIESESLPVDLHILISDIIQGSGHETDIFPYFMKHAKVTFPHINCLDDLKKISDLRRPSNWYPVARSIKRNIIFHAGPTNSGKTYCALKSFINAKSGIYCSPLKLLAVEVFNKCNNSGTSCDLITGEERRYHKNESNPAQHISSTVEMMNLNSICDVAVIDEIQLMRDTGRGWAWTRALLGTPAHEVHLCGEISAIDLVESVCATIGETVEVRKYKRLTNLIIENKALNSLLNVQSGDCIVCFSKNDIYAVSRFLEQNNIEVAVIYGSLPPQTKLAQAAKFNDIYHPCKVLVATDAIGMGLNLHIRRLIFYSLIKTTVNKKGEKEMNTLCVSSALQIAGRAGRYGTQWKEGYVTTFKSEDLPTLKSLLDQTPETLTQAGLHPTADQIELYAYHLPKTPLSNLVDIFVSLCTVDSLYFMCNVDDFKFLADMIQHIPLPLRARYVFCCAPINKKLPFVCAMFIKFARQYCKNEPISFEWLSEHIGWPIKLPKTFTDLSHLEAVFDVLDLYLWLNYRFTDLFPHITLVEKMQKELDVIIQQSIYQMTKNLKPLESESSAKTTLFESGYKGKLTKQLLDKGLITPKMLQELQREWSEINNKEKKNDTFICVII